ncbi:MAG: hypothetical protein ACXVPN_09880 [Bacteroidia bacterium]
MKFHQLLALFAALLFSCSNPEKPKENSVIAEKKDSLFVNNKELQKSVSLFKETSLPLTIDTTFIFMSGGGDSLGSFEIRALSANIFKHALSGGLEYNLNTFCRIDSIKEAGKYQQYIDSLDIGMTKVSTAHALSEFRLDSNTLILVWSLYSSSYEACPSSESWTVYATVVYKGDVKETCLLGECSSWVDPPVATERMITSKITAEGIITTDVYQMNDQDMDSAEVEIIREKYSFAVKDGFIKTLGEGKNPAVKEKRKVQNDAKN